MDMLQVPPRPELEGQYRLTLARWDEWLHTELFTWRWWLLMAFMVGTAVIWWIKVDKSRLGEITLYTAIVLLFIITLDELGEELGLWYYPVDVFFLFPPTTAIDISCMPLFYTLIYQKYRSWPAFIGATVVMALAFCFVFEQIAVWIGIYKMLIWKSVYGLPIYIFIALFSKFTVSRIYKMTARPVRAGK